MFSKDELMSRVREYTQKHHLSLGDELGAGVHGMVFTAESQQENPQIRGRSAIKVHWREPGYIQERDVYQRLEDNSVTSIRGCDLPQLLRYDNDLYVIEMTIVSRPFVLDFAGAYLDNAPDFSQEVQADWRAEKQEQFGEDWAEVQAILRELQSFGIFMIDVSPGNISFRE